MSKVITSNLDLWARVPLSQSGGRRGGNSKPEAYGVKKLRELILMLAVRGKLVEQDSNDEPASELLKRIASEKARLVKAGEIKKSKSKQVGRFNTLCELPESWEWATLSDLFLYDAGVKRQPKNLKQKLWLLELEDIEKDSGRLLVRITASERESKSIKSEFRVGDILYGKLRPYLNKVLVADRPGYSTTEIVALRPLLRLCPQYCALALRRPDFVDYVTRVGQGTKMPRLRTEDAAVAPFPLPPLAEQHRIVAKVDELMALSDQLEQQDTHSIEVHQTLVETLLGALTRTASTEALDESWTRLASHFDTLFTTEHSIDELKETILQFGIKGLLVTQDPNDEDVRALLASSDRRRREVAESDRRAGVDPQPILSAEDRWEVPETWAWRGLADFAVVC